MLVKIVLFGALTLLLLCGLLLWFIANPLYTMPSRAGIPVIPVSKERLYKDVETLVSTSAPRNSENIAALNEAAAYIHGEFARLGLEVREQVYEVNGQHYKNILASFGPQGGERVVVGAHYDVCGEQPGADDNASGIAGLLEIARLLVNQGARPRYGIDLVAYTLEEPPFFRSPYMGSAVHARSLRESGVTVKAMICLEMIGYFSDKPSSQEYPNPLLKLVYPNRGNFIAVVGHTGLRGVTKDVKGWMIAASSIDVYSINAPAIVPGLDFSDHRNYWAEGYPALMITDTAFYRNANYHEASDTIATLDFDSMAEVVKGVYWSVVQLASE